MSCALKFMKFILFSLNLFFVLIGLALVVAGAWAIFNIPSFTQALAFALDAGVGGNELYQNAMLTQAIAYTCIGLGLFVFLVAFFGCCGVITDSYCLLITYAIVVSILFLAKVICILLFLLLGDTIIPIAIDKAQESFSANYRGYLGLEHKDDPTTSYSLTADTVMLNFQCCGINGADDFKDRLTSALWQQEGRVYITVDGLELTGDAVGLPTACCRFKNFDFQTNSTFKQLHSSMVDPKCPVNPVSAYNEIGCVQRISTSLKQHTVVIAVAPVIIAVVEVIGVILASALAHEIKQDVEGSSY